MNSALLPLAVTCTALYLGLGLLPFAPAGVSWGEALALLPERLFAQGIPIVPLLLALPLGLFWQGAVRPRTTSARRAAAGAVFLALGVLAVLLQLGQIYFPPKLAVSSGLFAPLLGFAAGMTLWCLLGPPISRLPSTLPRLLWPLLVAAGAGSVLLPLDLGVLLNAPSLPAGLSSFVSDLPLRGYLLLKSAILWVPVGFLYTISGRGDAVPRWGVAIAVALLLEALPLLGGQPLSEALELLFALPGLWAGAWLGLRSLPGLRAPTAARQPTAMAARAAAAEVRVTPAAALDHRIEPPEPKPPRRRRSAPRPDPGPEGAAPSAASTYRPHRRNSENTLRERVHLLRIITGVILLLAASVSLFVYPLWQFALAVSLGAYALALWRWPLTWLVLVPAALPLLDFAPWTGRFFFDEFDILMLVTVGVVLMRAYRWRTGRLNPAWLLITLGALALIVSAGIGLGSPPPLDANAFSSYWSPYNSLRVAKGFVWGGLVFMLIRLARPEPAKLARLFAIGTGLGLLGVCLVGLWERWLFAGFANDANTYRIVSTFSSMHTGGGHIEAYLVSALPFLWLGMARWKTLPMVVSVMALTVYVTIFTVARGGVLALGVVLAILALASVRLAWRAGRRAHAAVPIGILALMAAGLLAGIGGGYFQQRMAQSGGDWQIRMDHWKQAIAMMDGGPMTQLFGMGLGSFPRVFLERGPLDQQMATYGFLTENGNTWLRLGSGETLYYAQRVAVQAGHHYRLEVDARVGGIRHDAKPKPEPTPDIAAVQATAASFATPVCEKQLLNSRRCVWLKHEVADDGRWHRLTRDFDSGVVGVESGLQRPPVEMFLYYPGTSGHLDVDNVRLLDEHGDNLIGNGGFTWGGDYWFFKTHSHLPWHIKNVWVHVLFEQGWVGLLLFAALIVTALVRLARTAWTGEPLAWVWLASLLGLLTVGMFDSLLDTPRLATLLIAFTLLGAGYDWRSAGHDAPHRRHRHHTRRASGESRDASQPPGEVLQDNASPSSAR